MDGKERQLPSQKEIGYEAAKERDISAQHSSADCSVLTLPAIWGALEG
jgi:hypothetical protein